MELMQGCSTSGLLVVFAAVFVVTYLWKGRQNSRRKLPPSLPWLPVVGSLPFLPTSMEKLTKMFVDSRNGKYGKVMSFYVGSKQTVLLSGKEAIHEALIVKAVDFADRPHTKLGKMFNENFKGIVLHSYNSEFKRLHQLCLSILRRFGFGQRVMETRILMEAEDLTERIRALEGRPFNVKKLMTACVANVILNILFGRRFEHSDPAFEQLIDEVNQLIERGSFALDVFPMLRFLPYYKTHLSESMKLFNRINHDINRLIAEAKCAEKTTENFVSCYMEMEGSRLDLEQLSISIRDLIAAGMETTATTIRWAIVLLTNHVEVQDRLRAEIDSVVGTERLPSLDDRARLPYVEATILELMRFKTLAPLSVPHYTLNDTEIFGYFVPRETMVLVNLYSVHMDPNNWDQPELFRPDRFLDKSGNVVGKERIIPFSLGKRSCLGEQLARQEIFLFLVTLLQHFVFKPPEGRDSLDVDEKWGAVLEPSPHEVRLVSRAT